VTDSISIHIGLNRVNPNAYNGWDGALQGCVNDATAMQRIAQSLGYTSTIILNDEATANRVISELGQAAFNLDPGGIVFLSYSGHGGQIPDANGDEPPGGKDETWVLYDRQLIDDELYNMWNQFPAQARIFVVSDSCHSGTVTRDLEYMSASQAAPFAAHYRTRSGRRASEASRRRLLQSTISRTSPCTTPCSSLPAAARAARWRPACC